MKKKKNFLFVILVMMLVCMGSIMHTKDSHAADSAIGDDYPMKWKNLPLGATVDDWKLYTRYCTSFVANRLSLVNKFEIPLAYGDAKVWGIRAKMEGYPVNMNPARGSIAWWGDNKNHVAWVAAVDGNNVLLEEYNYDYRGNYHSRWINKSDVYGYIHFKDIPSTPDTTQINKYLTVTKDGQDFYGNVDCTQKKGKTERGRIYYSKIAYKLSNGQLLYSVYTDDKATEWLGYLKEGSSEFTQIQTFNKKQVTLTNSSATLWKDLNYKEKIGTAVAGDVYVVNRVFYNSTNKAYYHELYRGTTFCGYINSDFVKDLTSQQINKYITITESNHDIFGNLERTSLKGKTERGRIYYSKIAYRLGNGQLLYSVYTDDKATEWIGYLKEGTSEFTQIQTFNKKQVTLTNSGATLWKDLNYKGKMGTAVAGNVYSINRVFYNSTNNAYYHELYRGTTFCGYINSDFVKDLTSQQINKYITITEANYEIFGNLERTSLKGKTERERIYYVAGAYNLGDGSLLYSVYTDDKMTEWIGYLKEGASEFTQIQLFDEKWITISKSGYTLWKDLNYTGKMGISSTGDIYIVNRVFYNLTNNAYYYELFKDDVFCGYINSEAVKDYVTEENNIEKNLPEEKETIETYDSTSISEETVSSSSEETMDSKTDLSKTIQGLDDVQGSTYSHDINK